MEIRWVDRDGEGKLCGSYARRQTWHKDADFLAVGDAELLAHDASGKTLMEAAAAKAAEAEATVDDLKTRLTTAEATITKLGGDVAALVNG